MYVYMFVEMSIVLTDTGITCTKSLREAHNFKKDFKFKFI